MSRLLWGYSLFPLHIAPIRWLAPDSVDGYHTKKVFEMKVYHYFPKSQKWGIYETEGRLAYRNGEVVILNRAWDTEITAESDPQDILYINYTAFVDAVKEFIQKVAEMETFEGEVGKLQKIIEILES